MTTDTANAVREAYEAGLGDRDKLAARFESAINTVLRERDDARARARLFEAKLAMLQNNINALINRSEAGDPLVRDITGRPFPLGISVADLRALLDQPARREDATEKAAS